MCRLSLFCVSGEWESVEESLGSDISAYVSTVEVDALAKGTYGILRTFSSLSALGLKVLSVDPLN